MRFFKQKEDEVEDTEVEEPKGKDPEPLYVCIKKCYIKMRLLDIEDTIRLSDKEVRGCSNCLVPKKEAPVVEEVVEEEPTTLGGIQAQEAQKVIDDLKGGQSPEPEVPAASGAAEDFLN